MSHTIGRAYVVETEQSQQQQRSWAQRVACGVGRLGRGGRRDDDDNGEGAEWMGYRTTDSTM